MGEAMRGFDVWQLILPSNSGSLDTTMDKARSWKQEINILKN